MGGIPGLRGGLPVLFLQGPLENPGDKEREQKTEETMRDEDEKRKGVGMREWEDLIELNLIV